MALDVLRELTPIRNEIKVVGGGSRSSLWRQIHADVYGLKIVKTNIDQDAAAIGAAALAAVGTGLWQDFDPLKKLHKIDSVSLVDPTNNTIYEQLLPIFKQAGFHLAELGDSMARVLSSA
jgi:xylulokinase